MWTWYIYSLIVSVLNNLNNNEPVTPTKCYLMCFFHGHSMKPWNLCVTVKFRDKLFSYVNMVSSIFLMQSQWLLYLDHDHNVDSVCSCSSLFNDDVEPVLAKNLSPKTLSSLRSHISHFYSQLGMHQYIDWTSVLAGIACGWLIFISADKIGFEDASGRC